MLRRAFPLSMPLLAMVFAASLAAQSVPFTGGKSEADAIIGSLREASLGALDLVAGAGRVGVLIVENSTGDAELAVASGSPLMTSVPVLGWALTATQATTLLALPAAGGGFARDTLSEAILMQTLRAADVEVVDLPPLLDPQAAGGVDLILAGSTAGSVRRMVTRETFFRRQTWFTSESHLHLRTVDPRTGTVLATESFRGEDNVQLIDELKIGALAVSAATVVTGLIVLIVVLD